MQEAVTTGLKLLSPFPLLVDKEKVLNRAGLAFPPSPTSPTGVLVTLLASSVIHKVSWLLGPVLVLTPGGKALSCLTWLTLLDC